MLRVEHQSESADLYTEDHGPFFAIMYEIKFVRMVTGGVEYASPAKRTGGGFSATMK